MNFLHEFSLFSFKGLPFFFKLSVLPLFGLFWPQLKNFTLQKNKDLAKKKNVDSEFEIRETCDEHLIKTIYNEYFHSNFSLWFKNIVKLQSLRKWWKQQKVKGNQFYQWQLCQFQFLAN